MMNQNSLSCCCWALSGPDEEVLTQIAQLGFTTLDLRPADFLPSTSRKRMHSLGLSVSCLAASFGIPEDASLSHADPALLNRARAAVIAAMDRAATLGASGAYVIPDLDDSPDALARYADSLATLADHAQGLGLKVLVEHFPGRALPTVAGTLAFLRKIDHPNLYLLYDIGHVQISGESIAGTIRDAGPLLGHVHLDDNDGVGDLHWALLDGVMTRASLHELFTTLDEIGFDGGVSIELNPTLTDPHAAIQRSRDVVLSLSL